jgi:hypothetical protein
VTILNFIVLVANKTCMLVLLSNHSRENVNTRLDFG